MVDPFLSRLWFFRFQYLLICILVIFFHLLPLQTTPPRFAAPDFLFCITAAWVVRRPEHLPVLLIAFIFFNADLFFHNPPGLMAMLVIFATEFLRSRSIYVREYPFLIEWLMFGVVLCALWFANRLVFFVLILPPPPLWLSLTQVIATLIAYPLVVAGLHWILRVQFAEPGEVERGRL